MMISKDMLGRVILTCTLFLTTTALPTTSTPTSTTSSTESTSTTGPGQVDFSQAAIFACANSQFPGNPLDMLFPPSDLTVPLIDNATRAALFQKQSVSAFCGRRQQYATCVQERLRNPSSQTDRLISVYIDVENFDSAMELYCNNTVEVLEQFDCTIQAVKAHPCHLGGTNGIIYLLHVALINAMSQEHFCALVASSIQCRVQCQLQTCGGGYANFMEDVYYYLVGSYCPKQAQTLKCSSTVSN